MRSFLFDIEPAASKRALSEECFEDQLYHDLQCDYLLKRAHENLVDRLENRRWSPAAQEQWLKTCLADIQLRDKSLVARVLQVLLKFSDEMFPLMIEFVRNHSLHALPVLLQENCPKSLWLLATIDHAVSVDQKTISQSNLWSFPLRLNANLVDNDEICAILDKKDSNFTKINVDFTLQFLARNTVYASVRVMAKLFSLGSNVFDQKSKELARMIIVDNQLLFSIFKELKKLVPLNFHCIESALDVAETINSIETITFLQTFLDMQNDFWYDCASWLASRPICFGYISTEIIARINGLPIVPSSFLMRASLVNLEVVKINSVEETQKWELSKLTFLEKSCLGASIIHSTMSTSKILKLGQLHYLLDSITSPTGLDLMTSASAIHFSHTLFNTGIAKSRPMEVFFELDCNAISNNLEFLRRAFLHDTSAQIKAETAAFLALSSIGKPALFEKMSAALYDVTNTGFQQLVSQSLSTNFSEYLLNVVSSSSSQYQKRISQLQGIVRSCEESDPIALESYFSAFLYEFGQRYSNFANVSENLFIDITCLKTYLILLQTKASKHFDKVFSLIAAPFVASYNSSMREQWDLLLSEVKPQSTDSSASLSTFKILKYLVAQNPPPILSLDLNFENISSLSPPSIFGEFLDKLSCRIRDKSDEIDDNFKKILIQETEKFVASTPNANLSIRLRMHLFNFGCHASLSSISENDTTSTNYPKIEELCCFNQIHSIRFSINQIKRLLTLHATESHDAKRNCCAFTIQKVGRHLGLTSPTCDIWDAFSEGRKQQLGRFLTSKYRFEPELDTRTGPFSLKAESPSDWIWSLYSRIVNLFTFSPETQAFLKKYSALFAIDPIENFTPFVAMVIAAILRVDFFGNEIVQEAVVATSCSSEDIKKAILVLYDYLFYFFTKCRDGEIDASIEELARLKSVVTLVSYDTLIQLSEEVGDSKRLSKFYELKFLSLDEKKGAQPILKKLQRVLYLIDENENANGLADFFNPFDIRQLSYALENEHMFRSATDARSNLLKGEAFDSFDADQLLNSLAQQKRFDDVLELIHHKIRKDEKLVETMKRHENEACISLGKWEIASEDYDSFGESMNENFNSIKGLMDLIDTSLEIDDKNLKLVDHKLFSDCLALRLLGNSEIESSLEGMWSSFDDEYNRGLDSMRLCLINSANICEQKKASLSTRVHLRIIKSLRAQNLFAEALDSFLSLDEDLRIKHVQLEAKLLKENGLVMKAIELLQFSVEEKLVSTDEVFKVQIKLADYKHISGHFTEKEILNHYELATKLSNDSRIYYRFAKYLDQNFGLLATQMDEMVMKRSYLALKNYSRALMTSSRHDVEVVPRFLTIWLDTSANAKKAIWSEKCNTVVEKASRLIRPDQFFRSLPQLVSRISHSNTKTTGLLDLILGKLFSAHPHITLWSLMSAVKCTQTARQQRAIDLLLRFRRDSTHGNLCKIYSNFADLLLTVCNQTFPKTITTVSVSKDFPALRKAIPCEVMIPAAMNKIAGPLVTVDSFLDKIEIISSMQRPKKICMRGSDGAWYPFLCKPNDDLRKDYRTIEMIDLINELQGKSGQRKLSKYLKVTRFSVTPLNEESGIIEWVGNTQSFRSLIQETYARDGQPYRYREMLNHDPRKHPDPVTFFLNEAIPKFPLAFDRWMLERFPFAEQWIEARNVFTGSTASMSVLGYIIGLGDRHCENILIDRMSGKSVHVDFNCLFEKGKTFGIPEVVPFRLTRNMIAVMGLAEWRGLFLKCAESTMDLLRENKDLFQTNLESFIYDPMVEWTKGKRADGETINEQGLVIMHNVLQKILGQNGNKTFPTTRGHVLDLIDEATSVQNLARMYTGWCAFI